MSLALIGPSTAYSIHTTQKCALTVNGGNDNLSAWITQNRENAVGPLQFSSAQISTVAELPPLTPQIASTSVDKNLDSHVPAATHSSLDPVALTPFAQSANAIDIPVSDSSLQMSTSEQPLAETLSNNPPSTFYGQKRSHISPFDISPNERPRRKRLTATLLTGNPFLQELKEAAKKKKKASNCTKGKETARTNEEPLVRKRSQTVLFSPESWPQKKAQKSQILCAVCGIQLLDDKKKKNGCAWIHCRMCNNWYHNECQRT